MVIAVYHILQGATRIVWHMHACTFLLVEAQQAMSLCHFVLLIIGPVTMCLCCRTQHHIDQKVLQPGFNLLLQTTADLAQDDGLHEPIMHLWLMLLAAAVIRRDAPLEQQIRTMVEQTAQRLPGLDQSMVCMWTHQPYQQLSCYVRVAGYAKHHVISLVLHLCCLQ